MYIPRFAHINGYRRPENNEIRFYSVDCFQLGTTLMTILKKTVGYFLKSKDKVFETFKAFRALVDQRKQTCPPNALEETTEQST